MRTRTRPRLRTGPDTLRCGLQAFYTLDAHARDASPAGRHLAPTGPTYAAGRTGAGQCLATGIADRTPLGGLAARGPLTLSAWQQTHDADFDGAAMTVGWPNTRVFVAGTAGNGQTFRFEGPAVAVVTDPVSDLTWYHVAFTLSAGAWVFYLNGAQIGTGAGNPADDFTLAKFSISDASSDAESHTDDVGVWNRALTAAEVARLAASWRP